MKTLTPAMLLKALKLFRGFTKVAGEYFRAKERLRYLLAAAVSIAQGRGGKLLKDFQLLVRSMTRGWESLLPSIDVTGFEKRPARYPCPA